MTGMREARKRRTEEEDNTTGGEDERVKDGDKGKECGGNSSPPRHFCEFHAYEFQVKTCQS